MKTTIVGVVGFDTVHSLRESIGPEKPKSRVMARWISPKIVAKSKSVCATCNTGWMSDLEGSVKGVLSPMITSGDATVLDIRRQVALAAWATKTAMLFEYVSTGREPYYSDQEHRVLRRTLTPPPGVCRVWAGRYTGPSLACDHLAFLFQSPKTQVYVSTIFVGEYVTQVLAHRPGKIAVRNIHPASRRGAWRDSLLQIWPATDVGIMWPPSLGLGPDIVQLLRYRFAPIGTFTHDHPHRRDGTLKP